MMITLRQSLTRLRPAHLRVSIRIVALLAVAIGAATRTEADTIVDDFSAPNPGNYDSVEISAGDSVNNFNVSGGVFAPNQTSLETEVWMWTGSPERLDVGESVSLDILTLETDGSEMAIVLSLDDGLSGAAIAAEIRMSWFGGTGTLVERVNFGADNNISLAGALGPSTIAVTRSADTTFDWEVTGSLTGSGSVEWPDAAGMPLFFGLNSFNLAGDSLNQADNLAIDATIIDDFSTSIPGNYNFIETFDGDGLNNFNIGGGVFAPNQSSVETEAWMWTGSPERLAVGESVLLDVLAVEPGGSEVAIVLGVTSELSGVTLGAEFRLSNNGGAGTLIERINFSAETNNPLTGTFGASTIAVTRTADTTFDWEVTGSLTGSGSVAWPDAAGTPLFFGMSSFDFAGNGTNQMDSLTICTAATPPTPVGVAMIIDDFSTSNPGNYNFIETFNGDGLNNFNVSGEVFAPDQTQQGTEVWMWTGSPERLDVGESVSLDILTLETDGSEMAIVLGLDTGLSGAAIAAEIRMSWSGGSGTLIERINFGADNNIALAGALGPSTILVSRTADTTFDWEVSGSLTGSGSVEWPDAAGSPLFFGMNSFNFVGNSANQMDNLTLWTPGLGFAITKIEYSPADDIVTLTWPSRPGTTYGVFFSTDLIDWGADLNDSVLADAGETTTEIFDLNVFNLQDEPVLFFRVERN